MKKDKKKLTPSEKYQQLKKHTEERYESKRRRWKNYSY
jgi:hypothetical protein